MPVKLNGATSGSVTITAPAVAGNTTLTLPSTSGTINTSGAVNEVPAGSAAAPSIYSTGDTNTGIFFPAADTVGIATGGTEMVRVASAGQIGIGGANYGTSGQVLTSGGAAAAPSWAAVPSSAPTTAQVLTATAAASYDAVGTYVFGRQTSGSNTAAGGTCAGSAINVTNVAANAGSTLSGTWRCMGISNSPGVTTTSVTLWLRIS